jgi:hypothetical protein
MEHTKDERTGSHIVIPTTIFYLLLAAAGLGGSGAYSVVLPKLGGAQGNDCAVDAKAALELGVQQARLISNMQDKIEEAARQRYTYVDHQKFAAEQESAHNAQDRRLTLLERIVYGDK